MNRILSDIRAYGLQYMRTKVGPFFAFAFPVLLILLFGAIFQDTNQNLTIYIQDQDNSPASHGFLQGLNATNVTSLKMIPAEANITDYIKEHALAVAIQIPPHFNDTIAAGGPAVIFAYGDPSRSTYGQTAGIVEGVVNGMNFRLNNATPVIGVAPQQVASPEFRFIDFFVPGILGMTVMFNSMFGMTQSVAEYKTRRYFKLIATTPITKQEWMLSRIGFYLLLALGSMTAMIVVGEALWGLKVAFSPVSVLILACSVILFTSFGVIVGGYAKDPESGQAIANAVAFPMMFLSGTFFQLETAPAYLRSVAAIFPLTYANDGLRASMIYGNEAGALANLAVVAVMAAVSLVAAVKLIRWTRD